MNQTRIVPIVAALLLCLPAPASADIDVTPSKRKPSVYLKGKDVSKPARSPQNPSTANPVASKEPAFDPIVSCRTDAVLGIYGCRDVEPPEPEADGPEVTPGDVLRAVREIGLPSLRLNVQPGAETLVNVETILYAEPQPFERSIELLGFDVDLAAEPVGYRWVHGDGTSATTTDPGRPYPAMDVVHRYTEPDDDVRASVDVTYRVRFRVDGGPWQTIGQTLVAAGPPTALDVDEAAPVMTRP